MPVIGTPRTFFKKFKYVIEVDGLASTGFQKCSELSVEVANIEYHEGGTLIPQPMICAYRVMPPLGRMRPRPG